MKIQQKLMVVALASATLTVRAIVNKKIKEARFKRWDRNFDLMKANMVDPEDAIDIGIRFNEIVKDF